MTSTAASPEAPSGPIDAGSPDVVANASTAEALDGPEVYQRLGQITRQLHDMLAQLGLMPQLQIAAQGLPDARSRLTYIAEKTADAANRVLNSVEAAKHEQGVINSYTRRLAEEIVRDPVKAVASGAVLNFVGDVERATLRMDSHLTDIMMAQDFHDLTGQVVSKVIRIAQDLEANLLKLLLEATPTDHEVKAEGAAGPAGPAVLAPAAAVWTASGVAGAADAAAAPHGELQGPVVDASGRSDVVTSQGEVDDLLASLGF